MNKVNIQEEYNWDMVFKIYMPILIASFSPIFLGLFPMLFIAECKDCSFLTDMGQILLGSLSLIISTSYYANLNKEPVIRAFSFPRFYYKWGVLALSVISIILYILIFISKYCDTSFHINNFWLYVFGFSNLFAALYFLFRAVKFYVMKLPKEMEDPKFLNNEKKNIIENQIGSNNE